MLQKMLIKLLLVITAAVRFRMEVVVKTALGDLPVVGSFLGGNTLTLGYAEEEMQLMLIH